MPLTNGEIVNETRVLPDFNRIHISDNIDIRLIKSDSCYIEFTAGENIMQNIISDVVDDILIVRNDNMGNIFRNSEFRPMANIYYDSDIYEIYYHSIGDLFSDDFINDDTLSVFDFDVEAGCGTIDLKLKCRRINLNYYDGTACVNIEGSSDTIDIFRKGLGVIHFEEVSAKIADIMLYRGNDIYVNCSDSICARIYDFGNIYYKGQPEINSYISPDALGRLLEIENLKN
mgnify:FL=1